MRQLFLVENRFYFFGNEKSINRTTYLINVMTLIILIYIGIYYIAQNWFKIKKIAIEGDTDHILTKQLSFIVKDQLNGTFFTLNIDELQNKFKKIPWVKDVTVYRNFPDGITVKIEEYKVIGDLGKGSLLTHDGQVFSVDDDSNNINFPYFDVDNTNINDLLKIYELIMPFLNEKNLKLTRLYLSSSGITKIHLSNDMIVTICSFDISNKWDILVKYWDRLYKINPLLNSINMCYKNAVAINAYIPESSKAPVFSQIKNTR